MDCPADRPHHHNPQTLLLSSAGGEVASRAEEHSASQGIRHRGGVRGNRVPGPQHTTPPQHSTHHGETPPPTVTHQPGQERAGGGWAARDRSRGYKLKYRHDKCNHRKIRGTGESDKKWRKHKQRD